MTLFYLRNILRFSNTQKIDEKDFANNNIKLIEEAVSNGVIGLKVYKSLGLTDKDKNNNRIKVDRKRSCRERV